MLNVHKAESELVLACAMAFLSACGSRETPADNQSSEQNAPVAGAVIERLDPELDAVIAPGAVVEKIADGFVFTEGPMWREGRLWFSDLQGNTVYAVTPDGQKETLIKEAGGLATIPPGSYMGPNAMVPDKDGSVLLAQHGARRIARVGSDLTPVALISDYQGKRLNSPNDLVYAPDDSLWFTDPPFGLPQADTDPEKELSFNGVFRYADGQLTAEITDLKLPNGIAVSADGKTLYVNNFGPDMKLMAYQIGDDGHVSGEGRALLTYTGDEGPGGPDGLKIDEAGNLWATGPGGIRIITPEGKILGLIKTPKAAANLAFGDDDGKTVYITSVDTIYKVRSNIAGVMPRFSK